jgi:hypothetical protein
VTEEPILISGALAQSFARSDMGLGLYGPFPVGTLHSANFERLHAWQERYHPTVKRRTPKKRKRKHGSR